MALNEKTIRRIVTAGLLLAITLLLAFTRYGFIPAPTPAGNATVVHIPAIIGGILEGPLVGLIVGLGFGLASFMQATIPAFKDPLVAILPRLCIGVVAAWVYSLLQRADKRALRVVLALLLLLSLFASYQIARTEADPASAGLGNIAKGVIVAVLAIAGTVFLFLWLRREDVRVVSLAIAGAAGSLTNTVLVLSIASLRGYWPAEASWLIGLTHGVPEVIVSGIIVVAVVTALRQIGQRRGRSHL